MKLYVPLPAEATPVTKPLLLSPLISFDKWTTDRYSYYNLFSSICSISLTLCFFIRGINIGTIGPNDLKCDCVALKMSG